MMILTRDDLHWWLRTSALVIGSFALAFLLAAASSPDHGNTDVLRQPVATLLGNLDPGYPVVVRVEALPDAVGDTDWDEAAQGYVIRLDPSVLRDEAFLRHVLAHEWAHVMVWDAVVQGNHDALWGVAFARAYRTLSRG